MVARGVESEEIRVIGPARAPSRAGGAIRVDRLLADLAERRAIAYVSVIDIELDYLDDQQHLTDAGDRKSDEKGKSVAVRVDVGGSRIIKQKNSKNKKSKQLKQIK